jgi:hypothetical protein
VTEMPKHLFTSDSSAAVGSATFGRTLRQDREAASPFDSVADRFFSEGEAMSDAPAPDDVWNERTFVCARRRRRRTQVSWAAAVALVIGGCAGLACWHARRSPPGPKPAAASAGPAARPPTSISPSPTAPTTILAPAAPTSEPPSPQTGAAGTLPSSPETESAALCRAAIAKRHSKDVLARCAPAFAANPQDAGLATLLAKTEFDRGHSREALAWARRALALDESQADAYVFVGGAEQTAGHRAAAKSAYRRYLELAPRGRYAADLRVIVGTP